MLAKIGKNVKLKKVAITGGLSCGKSLVCRLLSELGAYVVSSDKIVHHLLSSDTNLGQEIIKLLGTSILVNQKINRFLIAQMVFRDFNLLQALEKILHPAVYDKIDQEYYLQEQTPHPPSLFVAEVPLLFESEGENHFDSSVAVIAPKEFCVQRFKEATGYDSAEYERRMSRQLSAIEKARRADYVLVNDGTLLDLKHKTIELYQNLIGN